MQASIGGAAGFSDYGETFTHGCNVGLVLDMDAVINDFYGLDTLVTAKVRRYDLTLSFIHSILFRIGTFLHKEQSG